MVAHLLHHRVAGELYQHTITRSDTFRAIIVGAPLIRKVVLLDSLEA